MLPNIDFLKLAQIFNPGSINSPATPNAGVISSGASRTDSQPDLMSMIQGMLSPKDTQFNKFEDMISQMPRREDYAPSKTRQVLAAIAGLGTGGPVGIAGGQPIGYQSNVPAELKVQSSINDSPYNKALSDWATRLEPQGEVAKMEQTRNTGNRATALGTLQRQQAQEKQDEIERRNLELENQGRNKLAIQQERADAYVKAKQFAQDHPTYKTVTDENGDVYFINPIDPKAEPIPAGVKQLSPMEKIDLGVQGTLKEIAARSSAAKDLEETKQGNRLELDKEKYPNGRPTSSRSSSGTTPTQDRVKRALTASDTVIQHPEWSKFIHVNKGVVTVDPPVDKSGISGYFKSGPDKDTYDKIVSALGLAQDSGSSASSNQNQTQQSLKPEPKRELTRPETNTALAAAKSKLESGYVLITRDGGKTFSQIPANNVNKLKPESGWVVVK